MRTTLTPLYSLVIVIALSFSSGVIAGSDKKTDDKDDTATNTKPGVSSSTFQRLSIKPPVKKPVLNTKHILIIPTPKPTAKIPKHTKPGKTGNAGLAVQGHKKLGGSQQPTSSLPTKKKPTTIAKPRNIHLQPQRIKVVTPSGFTLNKPALNKKKPTGVHLPAVQQVGHKGIQGSPGVLKKQSSNTGLPGTPQGSSVFGSRVKGIGLGNQAADKSGVGGLGVSNTGNTKGQGLDLNEPLTSKKGGGSSFTQGIGPSGQATALSGADSNRAGLLTIPAAGQGQPMTEKGRSETEGWASDDVTTFTEDEVHDLDNEAAAQEERDARNDHTDDSESKLPEQDIYDIWMAELAAEVAKDEAEKEAKEAAEKEEDDTEESGYVAGDNPDGGPINLDGPRRDSDDSSGGAGVTNPGREGGKDIASGTPIPRYDISGGAGVTTPSPEGAPLTTIPRSLLDNSVTGGSAVRPNQDGPPEGGQPLPQQGLEGGDPPEQM